MRSLLLAALLGGCYPVCVTDADCKDGYCQINGESRKCIACDPDDDTRACTDGRVCAALNMCVACASGNDCGAGFTCADDGTCQPAATDDGGESD